MRLGDVVKPAIERAVDAMKRLYSAFAKPLEVLNCAVYGGRNFWFLGAWPRVRLGIVAAQGLGIWAFAEVQQFT